jgi:hypothetical protein
MKENLFKDGYIHDRCKKNIKKKPLNMKLLKGCFTNAGLLTYSSGYFSSFHKAVIARQEQICM